MRRQFGLKKKLPADSTNFQVLHRPMVSILSNLDSPPRILIRILYLLLHSTLYIKVVLDSYLESSKISSSIPISLVVSVSMTQTSICSFLKDLFFSRLLRCQIPQFLFIVLASPFQASPLCLTSKCENAQGSYPGSLLCFYSLLRKEVSGFKYLINTPRSGLISEFQAYWSHFEMPNRHLKFNGTLLFLLFPVHQSF